MGILVALFAISLDRLVNIKPLRQFGWFGAYQSRLQTWLSQWSAYVMLISLVATPILLIILIQHLIADHYYGVLNLLFGILVLVYCLGPDSVFKKAETMNMSDATILSGAVEQYFSVLFWFMFLGLPGALLYRLVCLGEANDDATGIAKIAAQFKSILEWLPIRLLTLTFALVGNFLRTFNQWRLDWFKGVSSNTNLLEICGQAALDKNENDIQVTSDKPQARVLALLDRALIVWLIAFGLTVVF